MKGKNALWIFLAIAAIVGILIYLLIQYVKKVQENIIELKTDMRNDLRALRMVEQERNRLLKRATKIYRFVTLSFFVILLSTIAITIYFGWSYNDSIENIVGSTMLLLAVITVVIYCTWNPDVLLKRLNKYVLIWVYKKHGFNEASIDQLRMSISMKRDQIRQLEMIID